MKNIELLPVELTSWRECAQCGTKYVEVDNIGRLLCSVHPGIKLLNDRGQSYFSCCNRLNARDGCTRMDHTIEKFTYQSIELRFNQIQAFCIQIIPSLLIPYFYGPPPKDRILFQLPANFSLSRNMYDKLTFKLPVLYEGMKRFQSKLVDDKISPLDRIPQDGEPDFVQIYDGEDELKWVRETVLSKSLILDALLNQSLQSELFQRDLSAQDGKKMRGEKECEQIWKNINNPKYGDKNKSNIIINFMIITRIDRTILG